MDSARERRSLSSVAPGGDGAGEGGASFPLPLGDLLGDAAIWCLARAAVALAGREFELSWKRTRNEKEVLPSFRSLSRSELKTQVHIKRSDELDCMISRRIL